MMPTTTWCPQNADWAGTLHQPGTKSDRAFARLRFAGKTEPGPNGCILWTAAVVPLGYGTFYLDGRTQYAHRCALILADPDDRVAEDVVPLAGADGRRLDVAHRPSCPRRCVNAEHLCLVTHNAEAKAS